MAFFTGFSRTVGKMLFQAPQYLIVSVGAGGINIQRPLAVTGINAKEMRVLGKFNFSLHLLYNQLQVRDTASPLP